MSQPLDPILRPRSVAVIGASRNPRKRGFQALRALLDSEYRGRIYPVSRNGGEVLGLPTAKSLEDLEDTPDLAFICTPADSVPALLEMCGRRGVKGAVVSAVGFRESGEEGAALERQMLDVAGQYGIRLVGPNTSGVMNTSIGLNLVGVKEVQSGRLALLSQSGNLALDVIMWAAARSQGISIYVGVGNEADIAFHEYLEYLETDDNTAAILMYVEGFRNGRKFIEVAKRVSETKPIVLLKGGRSERGVVAARSHTGAIAGSYPVLRSSLRQGGVSEVRRSDELLLVGEVLAGQPPVPAGTGVVVITDGGGHGTLAADALAELGVEIAQLSTASRDRLRELLGRAASVDNPIDVAGAADQHPGIFTKVLEIVAADATVGGVLLVGLFGGYAVRFAEELAGEEEQAASAMAEIMAQAGKTFLVHSLYSATTAGPLRCLRDGGVPVLGSVEVAARCMRAAQARGLFLHQRPAPPPMALPRRTEPPSIVTARRERRTVLVETEARELVAEHGVTVAPATLCRTEDEVVAVAAELSEPLAIRVVSPAMPHKTEVGGVQLNIVGVDNARRAFRQVVESAATYAMARGLAPDVRGVLVGPMLPPPLAELIVGVRHDPQFGPVLTVGAGGIAVEVHHDASLRGLPIGRAEALEMLDEIRAARLLNGYRGRPAANREAIADLILGVAACALSHPEIGELEVNPVFAYADRVVALDVRGILRAVTIETPEEQKEQQEKSIA